MSDRANNTVFEQKVSTEIGRHLANIADEFLSHSMLNRTQFVENLFLVEQIGMKVEGSIVECGTWKGGMSAAMMKLCGPQRKYHFFDSFEGLPPAEEIDGIAAAEYQANKEGKYYYNNCKAEYDEFDSLIRSIPVHAGNLNVHKGWFDDTVPCYAGGPIAVLRLDGDFYNSTLCCLEHLYPHVVPGGIVILDDYNGWIGCSRAVHDYMSKIKSVSIIDRTVASKVAFIIKYDSK